MATLYDVLNTLRAGVATFRTIAPQHITSENIFVGNNAVVCRCEVAGVLCALKCYPRHRNNALAIYGDALHEREMTVYSLRGRVEYVDVVATPWIEGVTLDRLFGDAKTDYHDLMTRFERFALDVLRGEWAHGDIKPENIVLTPEGDLRLIDYDSAWLPGFTQSDMEEAGTPSFSHPLREARRFDKSIDDFSIALMVTMLAALSYDRGTFAPHIDADCALFSPHAVVSGVDRLLNAALALFERKGDKKHRDIAATLYNCSGPIPTLQRLLEG